MLHSPISHHRKVQSSLKQHWSRNISFVKFFFWCNLYIFASISQHASGHCLRVCLFFSSGPHDAKVKLLDAWPKLHSIVLYTDSLFQQWLMTSVFMFFFISVFIALKRLFLALLVESLMFVFSFLKTVLFSHLDFQIMCINIIHYITISVLLVFVISLFFDISQILKKV